MTQAPSQTQSQTVTQPRESAFDGFVLDTLCDVLFHSIIVKHISSGGRPIQR